MLLKMDKLLLMVLTLLCTESVHMLPASAAHSIPYNDTWASLDTRVTPTWFMDAKFMVYAARFSPTLEFDESIYFYT